MVVKKRGQVTIFVVLGIVILFTLVVFSYLIFGGRERMGGLFSSDFDEVKTHIENCVYQVLEDGIVYCGDGHCGSCSSADSCSEEYKSNLEDYILSNLPSCFNFPMFERVEVDAYSIDDVIVSVEDEKIKADVVFPVTMKKGNNEKKFTDFHSEFYRSEESCVDIKIINDDYIGCIADETKTVHISGLVLHYEPGDYVGVGGICIAC